jgi:O-antigen/teichoic acid export membrane protein
MAIKLKSDFFWIAGCQASALLVNIFLLKILTNKLSLEEYGYYSLFITIVIFARQLIYDPISYIVVRDCGRLKNSSEVSRNINAINFISDKLSLLIGAISIFIAIILYIQYGFSFPFVFVIGCGFYLATNGAGGIILAILNIIRKRQVYALLTIFDSLIKIASVGLVLELSDGDLIEAMGAITLGTILSYISARVYFNNFIVDESNNEKERNVLVSEILINSLPLYLPTFLVALKSVGERWMVAAYVGVEDLAVFNVFYQLGFSPVVMIIGVMQTFVAPSIYKHCQKEQKMHGEDVVKYIYRLIILVFTIGLLGCLIAMFFGSHILVHIISKEYYDYFDLFVIFIVAGVLAAATGITHLGVIGLYKATTAGKLMTIAMIFGILISVLSVIFWGLYGALFGLVASNTAAFALYIAALFYKQRACKLQ